VDIKEKLSIKLNVLATLGVVFFAALGFWLVSPANSGSDENWYAQNSWYLSENIGSILDKSQMTQYTFPNNLVINGSSINRTNLVPCWWDDLTIQSSCQIMDESNSTITVNFDRVSRAPFYQLLIGNAMHYPYWKNNYETGRLVSFLVSILIIALAIRNISISDYRGATPFIITVLTPSWYFLSSGINPISHEISLGILLASFLVRLESNRHSLKLNSQIIIVLILFGYSRPLAPIWAFFIILFYRILFGNNSVAKYLLFISMAVFISQFKIDSGTWRYGDGSPAPYIKPSLEFYVEELIRTLINLGNWIWQSFGNFRLGSSIEIPLIILLVYIITFWNYTAQIAKDLNKKTLIISSLLIAYFVIPICLHLFKSNRWPGWWSGRYQMPLFFALVLLLLIKNHKNNKFGFLAVTFFTVGFSSLLNFARWNWGLFPTYTPIISNGWSMSLSITILYFLSLLFFLLSAMVLTYNFNRPKLRGNRVG
jgi:hypothetical protein